MRLIYKKFDPVGGELLCRLDTSLFHQPDDHLNLLKKLVKWKNRIYIFLGCTRTVVYPIFLCFLVFHEVKHVEKLSEDV